MDKQDRQGIGKGDQVAGGSGPGSDNPALKETYEEQAGEITTAEFLLAREGAEEQRMRNQSAEMYADQSPTASSQQDADRDSTPGEYMESPRAEGSFLGGSGSGGTGQDTMQLEGEADALADRAGTQAAKSELPADVPNVGSDPQGDIYAEGEWGQANPPSEMDMIAPGMVYLPPADDDER
ncbi:MAG: hypothetical protein ABIQ44_11870 [Chloroflexia bacterium]